MKVRIRMEQLTDHHLVALYSHRRRLSKTLIRSVEGEIEQRGIGSTEINRYTEDIKPYARQSLSFKHQLLIILFGPLSHLAPSILIPVLGAVAANIEGKGYTRRVRTAWFCLALGYLFYLSIIVIVTMAVKANSLH